MRMQRLTRWLLLGIAALGGCNREGPPKSVVEDTVTHLPVSADVAAGDWLHLSRPELARRFEDWRVGTDKRRDLIRHDKQTVQLLPKLLPTLTLPVFHLAQFSARAGLTLPPYLADGARDSQLALHLARFGDADGALLLAPPGDAATRQQIEDLRTARNYLVEWTRLIAMIQFDAELRLASGEIEGAAVLVHLHEQLGAALDAKAAAGPLGAVLLSGGRRALEAATAAWRQAGKIGLADDVAAALATWGDVPALAPSLLPGASRAAVGKLLRGEGAGHAMMAFASNAARAFDLLTLPVPIDDFEGIAAFFDAKDQLAEMAVLYRSRAVQTYPDPGCLAQRCTDLGFAGQDVVETHGTLAQRYTGGGLTYDVTVVPRGAAIGGLVRVTDQKGTAAPAFPPPDPRDFAAVHFERTFEQNRIAIAPDLKTADAIVATRASDVRRVLPPGLALGIPVDLPPASAVQLERLSGHNLLNTLTLRWGRALNPVAQTRLLAPLWTAYGAAHIEADNDNNGGYLAFIWEDATTRYTLRLPHNDERAPEFVAEDKRGTQGLPQREKAAATFDRDQRAARLAAGKPLQRLARAFEEAPDVRLGTPRAKVAELLPGSKTLRKFEIADGWSVLFLKPAAGNAAYTSQQLFIRFGPTETVAELRMRYLERTLPKNDAMPSLLARLTIAAGQPDTLPAPWAGLWPDLPQQKPAATLHAWKDDLTAQTLQRDAGGAEVTLRDCSNEKGDGVDLPPLQFCSRGIEGCSIGDAREAVLQRWKVTEPTTTSDGGIVLPTPKASPYEAVVAYFENGKVHRLLAYHRQKADLRSEDVMPALQAAWGRDINQLGSVRRQDGPAGSSLGGLGWNDDKNRVRIFAMDNDQGPRLHTEWREWPLPGGKAIAAVP